MTRNGEKIAGKFQKNGEKLQKIEKRAKMARKLRIIVEYRENGKNCEKWQKRAGKFQKNCGKCRKIAKSCRKIAKKYLTRKRIIIR